MKSHKCTDSTIGELRHAYEIGALSVEDTEKFEIHMLECEACYEEVSQFDDAAELMRSDVEIRREVRQAADAGETRPSLVSTLIKYLWPETPLVFKPAVAFFALALLVYPAYRGMQGSGDSGLREIQSVSLLPNRSLSNASFLASPGQDGLISFVFPGAEVGMEYRLVIESSDGDEVMSIDSFTGFDQYETGRIVVPLGRLDDGSYRLVISDQVGADPYHEQIYVFEVNR